MLKRQVASSPPASQQLRAAACGGIGGGSGGGGANVGAMRGNLRPVDAGAPCWVVAAMATAVARAVGAADRWGLVSTRPVALRRRRWPLGCRGGVRPAPWGQPHLALAPLPKSVLPWRGWRRFPRRGSRARDRTRSACGKGSGKTGRASQQPRPRPGVAPTITGGGRATSRRARRAAAPQGLRRAKRRLATPLANAPASLRCRPTSGAAA